MPTQTDLYDAALEAMPIDPTGLLAFRLPGALQRRASALAARNATGKLTADGRIELEKFLALEAIVRAWKAKALTTKSA